METKMMCGERKRKERELTCTKKKTGKKKSKTRQINQTEVISTFFFFTVVAECNSARKNKNKNTYDDPFWMQDHLRSIFHNLLILVWCMSELFKIEKKKRRQKNSDEIKNELSVQLKQVPKRTSTHHLRYRRKNKKRKTPYCYFTPNVHATLPLKAQFSYSCE